MKLNTFAKLSVNFDDFLQLILFYSLLSRKKCGIAPVYSTISVCKKKFFYFEKQSLLIVFLANFVQKVAIIKECNSSTIIDISVHIILEFRDVTEFRDACLNSGILVLEFRDTCPWIQGHNSVGPSGCVRQKTDWIWWYNLFYFIISYISNHLFFLKFHPFFKIFQKFEWILDYNWAEFQKAWRIV